MKKMTMATMMHMMMVRHIVERFFTILKSASSEHYTIPTVTLTGDFEVELSASTTSTSLQSAISGGVAAGDLEIHISAAGVVLVVIAGVTVITGTVVVNDDKINVLKVTRVGSTITLLVNGVTDGTASDSATLTMDSIGQRTGGTLFFDGIIFDVKVTDAGALVRDYAIDEDWAGPSTVLVDSSTSGQDGTAVNITTVDAEFFIKEGSITWVGEDIVTNGDFDTDTGWTKGTGTTISGGVANFAGSTVNALFQNAGLVGSRTYRINSIVVATTLGIEVHAGGDASSGDFRGTGIQTWIVNTITPNGFLVFDGQGPGFTGTMDKVTARRVIEEA